jgi:hypothetical protein
MKINNKAGSRFSGSGFKGSAVQGSRVQRFKNQKSGFRLQKTEDRGRMIERFGN